MPKPVVNSRITYPNVYGRVIAHDNFLNQGVRLDDSPTFANLQLTGDAIVNGSLYVYGNTVVMNTNLTEFEDNILLLNRLETGPGVTLNQSGIEIERGTLENYRIVYNEPDGTFRSGVIGNIRPLVHRELLCLDNGIMFWNGTTGQIESRDTIAIPIRSGVTQESTSTTTGGLCLAGGLGVEKNVVMNGALWMSGNKITSVSGETVITTTRGITLATSDTVSIPYNRTLSFGNTRNSVSVNSGSNTLTVDMSGNIDFRLPPGFRINVPNQIPITFATQNEKVYTDGDNNMVIEGSQNIKLSPGTSKYVLVPETASMAFYNATQRVYGTIAADLVLTAGNDIQLTPGLLRDVRVPTDNGIRYGTARVSCDSADVLKIASAGDILLNPGTRVKVPAGVGMTFGDSATVVGDTSGGLAFTGHTTTVTGTRESTNPSNGSLVVRGGVGILGSTCIGGGLHVNGDLTVQGTTVTVDTETVVIKDNLLVLNSGPAGAADSGVLVKRYRNGVDSAGGENYAGMFYKESQDLWTFAYTDSDPGFTGVGITDFLGIQARVLRITETSDATNPSNGSIQTPGGIGVVKSAWVGDTVYSAAVSTGTFSTGIGNASQFRSTHANLVNVTVANTVFNESAVFTGNVSPVVEGTMYFTNTRPSTTLSSGSMIVYGGVVINNTANAAGPGHGGALSVAGGMWIGGDILVTGSINGVGNASNSYAYLTLTSTDQSVNSTSGSLVTFGGITIQATAEAESVTNGGGLLVLGGASIAKNLVVGGGVTSPYVNTQTLTANGALEYSGNGLLEYVNSTGWHYLGNLLDTEFFKVHVIGELYTLVVEASVESGVLNAVCTRHGGSGGGSFSKIVIYASGGDEHRVYLYNDSVCTLNVAIKKGESFIVTASGNVSDLEPDDLPMAATVEYDSETSTSHTGVTVGSTMIHGELRSTSRITRLGLGSAGEKALLLARYRISNDSGLGDGLDPSDAVLTDTLPAQLGVNLSQVKLSTAASSLDSAYVSYWIRAGDQVRHIVGYTGAQRVVHVDVPFTVQPAESDTVYLFNGSYRGMYNDTDNVLVFAKVDIHDGNVSVVDYTDIDIKGLNAHSDVYVTGGVTIASGGHLSVSGPGIVAGGLTVGSDVLVEGDLSFRAGADIMFDETFKVSHTTGALSVITGTTATLQFPMSGGSVLNGGVTLGSNTLVGGSGVIGLGATAGSRVLVGDTTELFCNSSAQVDIGVGSSGVLSVTDRCVHIQTTEYSESSSTGALRVDGGVTVKSEQNSVSFTNGGSLTVMGGMAVVKDLFIGGNIFLNGNVQSTGAAETPVLTFTSASNCTVTGYNNSSLIYVSNEAMLTFTVAIEATVAHSACTVEFTVPRRTNNFVLRSDLAGTASGYTGSLDTVYGALCVGVVGSTRGLIKFHSNDATIHYITVMARFTAS